jgi:hypothetical protein
MRKKQRSLESWEEDNQFGQQLRVTKESLDELPMLDPDEEYERNENYN